MFLEQLMEKMLEESVRAVLVLIVMQLNMLLCLVNDVLDIKILDEANVLIFLDSKRVG